MSLNKGSEWRKWDLHLHTPSSYDYKNKSITNQEIVNKLIENNIAVVAITDHHIIDINRIKELQSLGKDKVTILPGIEFLSDARGKQPIHFIGIFSEDCNLEHVWGQIENKTKINEVKGRDINVNEVYCNLEESISLIHKLGGIVTIHAGEKHSSIENITHSLEHGLAQKTDIANKVDFYELGKVSDQDGYNKIVFPSIKKYIPMILCSDNHNINKYELKENCWIKANPTFEGLKQVIYEPKHRVAIQKNKPNEALHKLEKIELSFDKNLKWDNDKFCFAGFNKVITLSPHLTCIIGGRGSGKSTLLNLIAQKIEKEETDFFKDLKVNTSDYIKFEPEFVENIEFLAQNTIESFATDSKKFTQAIFERIDKSANGKLVNIENDISNELKIYDEQIFMLKNRDNIDKKLKEQSENLVKYKNIIKTFKDKEYTDNKDKLQKVQKKIIEIESSRERYKELFLKIKEIYSLEKVTEKNKYDKYFNDLLSNLNTLYEKYKKYDYIEIKKELEQYKKDKNEYIQKIDKYLNAKGLSEENVKDAQQASLNIEKIENEIKKLNQDKKLIKDKLKSFSFIGLDSKINNFKTTIEEELKKINLKFENISKENTLDVKAIKVEYKLNEDIFDNIFEELTQILEINPKISLFRKAFKDYLQNNIDINDVLNISESSEFINKITDRKTQAYQVLLEIFNIKTNFDIYKLIIQKHKRDMKNNKFLKVYYDNKTLNNSSFGQKCTTAIVILLSLGNTPIIIDEPEAHLDSSLIANYLVELIKEQKQHRQIIFATHNANFVLNADAELIIKLQNDSGVTSISSFPIEDLAYREDLLRLEGGAEAFKKREKKYNISSFK